MVYEFVFYNIILFVVDFPFACLLKSGQASQCGSYTYGQLQVS